MLLFVLVGCQTTKDDQPLQATAVSTSISPPLPPLTNQTPNGLISLTDEPGNVTFETLSLADGLSQSSILTIFQDSFGYMWFGTLDGLNKYDGYNFTVYESDPDNPNSLSDNVVQAIYEDSNGNMWFGTVEGGLNKFDRITEQFITYKHDPNDNNSLGGNEVTAVTEDKNGNLWIATFGGGLNKFNPETETFTHYKHNPADLLSLSSNNVWTLFMSRTGALWVGTVGGGLNWFDPETGRAIRFLHDPSNPNSLSNNNIPAIFEDAQGQLWIGTYGGGLNRFDIFTGQFTHYRYDSRFDSGIGSDIILAIEQDKTGALWLGLADEGVDRFDPQNVRFTHFKHAANEVGSLSGDLVVSLYTDNSGVVWVGTGGAGLNKYDPSKRYFLHHRERQEGEEGLEGNSVSAILEDSLGILWIGTEAGLNKFNRTTNRVINYTHNPDDPLKSLSSNLVLSIFEDSEGMLWVGTRDGLNQFDRITERSTVYRANPLRTDSLIHNSVGAIFEDSQGELWIGTAVGLDKFDRETGRFIHYLHDVENENSLSRGGIRTIFEDSQGILWVGTSGGLNRFNRSLNNFTRYQYDPNNAASLSDNSVMSIHEDKNGVLWIGTHGGGLNKFDRENGTFHRFLKKHGLPNNSVYGILEDESGHLWLSTNNGLARFHQDNETFTVYDIQDGLQSNEFNANAHFKSESGELFFGGINGFNSFRPDNILDNPYVPPVVLTSITQSGETIAVDQAFDSLQTVTLGWPNNFFEFEFAALSFAQPEKNQYAYRLEGLEEEWNYVGPRPFGRYTNLPGGTYTLHIKGSNNDGVWNETGVSLAVVVVPPFWATWWFRALAVSLVLVGFIVGYRLRVTAVQNRNRELEQQVDERTQALARHTVELERRREIAEGLREIMLILNSNQSLADSLNYIVNQAATLTDAAEVVIYKMEADMKPTIIANSSKAHLNGFLQPYLPILQNRWQAKNGSASRPLQLSNLRQNGHNEFYKYASLLAVPLQVDGQLYGELVSFYEEPRDFSPEDVALGLSFADQAALAIANDDLRSQVKETAVTTERNRLARDLHDAVTQTLFSAGLIAEVLPATWDGNRSKGQKLLYELRQLNRGAIAEMRTLLMELRPSSLTDTNLTDLLKQLGDTVTGRTGVPVTVQVEGVCQLPPHVHETIYRIAQEACNNIVKHAQASQISLKLNCIKLHAHQSKACHVSLVVVDDGRGFDITRISPDRLGLQIMQERADAIGATCLIKSTPGKGTKITVTWEG